MFPFSKLYRPVRINFKAHSNCHWKIIANNFSINFSTPFYSKLILQNITLPSPFPVDAMYDKYFPAELSFLVPCGTKMLISICAPSWCSFSILLF